MKGNKVATPPLRVLFVCTGNSCRSQMAEGWARHILGNRVEAHSAGTEPGALHPGAIQVMGEAGVDISFQRSKSMDEFRGQPFDLVIILCDDAESLCPVFPGGSKRIHVGFPDPARAAGTEEEIMEAFRLIRDRIRRELIDLVEEEITRCRNHPL
ncbi:MAG: arsenate reductase ArsC [Deltaproteobacteria bacterium]|nr:arsenate reductase ArsC [Deltaproteobacteria bacterium]MBW2121736.1 arsenate reductase ArsC [Deltaproteobacteria bacterium]